MGRLKQITVPNCWFTAETLVVFWAVNVSLDKILETFIIPNLLSLQISGSQTISDCVMCMHTICESHRVTACHFVPGNLILPNFIWSKVCQTRLDTNGMNKIAVRNYNGLFWKQIKGSTQKCRNLFTEPDKQKRYLWLHILYRKTDIIFLMYHLESLRVPQFGNHCSRQG